MLIRPSEPEDAQAVKAVLLGTFESTWRPNISDEAVAIYLKEKRPDQYWQQRGDQFRVCEQAGHVVGFIDWQADFINALHVLPTYARRGIGSELLNIAEAEICNSGHGRVRLETDTFNSASRAFYARHGYSEVEQYPDEEWNSGLITVLLEKSL